MKTTDDQIRKQIVFWNTVNFVNISNIVDMFERQRLKQPPQKNDTIIRDFYFYGKLQPTWSIKPKQTFIERLLVYFKDFNTIDRTSFINSQLFEINVIKHQFWNRLWKMRPQSKQAFEDRNKVEKIVWSYRIPALMIFITFGTLLIQFSEIKRLKMNRKVIVIGGMAIGADIVTRYMKSSQIFYQIPKLNNQQLELQRLQIINESIVMDGMLNNTSKQNKISKELFKQAQKQQNKNIKKQILEAAGLIIVDKYDFQY